VRCSALQEEEEGETEADGWTQPADFGSKFSTKFQLPFDTVNMVGKISKFAGW
jgi:hypothetical protein